MAALDFPSSPTLNQIYSANGKSWIWDGSAWNPYGGTSSAMILLASATASNSASVTFDNVFNPSLYSEYVLKFQNVASASSSVDFRVQLRSATPSDITGTHRSNALLGRIDAATNPLNFAPLGGSTGWIIAGGISNLSNHFQSGFMSIMPFSGAWTSIYGLFYYVNASGQRYSYTLAGDCDSTTSPAGVKIYMSSGNISTGTFQLYGIKK